MNSASLILVATTILFFKYRSGATLVTSDTEVRSQEKILSLCSFVYVPMFLCSPLFTLNKQDSVLQQTGQKNAFFLKYNTQLLVASVLSYIYPLK